MERQKTTGVCLAPATPPQSAGATNSVVKPRADPPPSLLLEPTASPRGFQGNFTKQLLKLYFHK